MSFQDAIVPKIPATNIVAGATVATLGVFGYVISTMLFAPLIPNLWVLAIYVISIELIVYIVYKSLGWLWQPASRVLIALAILVGYFIGITFYQASLFVHQDAQVPVTTATKSKSSGKNAPNTA